MNFETIPALPPGGFLHLIQMDDGDDLLLHDDVLLHLLSLLHMRLESYQSFVFLQILSLQEQSSNDENDLRNVL